MDDRIADPWGERTPYGAGEEWPVRVDEHLPAGEPERWAQAASLLHSNGDAMDIAVVDGRIAGVRGRAADRVNRGRLDPIVGAADARDADLALRRAGHDRAAVDLGHQPGRVAPVTARRARTSPTGCTPSCSRAPARAASGCCGTSTTST